MKGDSLSPLHPSPFRLHTFCFTALQHIMSYVPDTLWNKNKTDYVVAVLSLIAVTGLLKLLGSHINATTVALAFLLVVLLVATRLGARPAVFVSILSMLFFNFF